MAKCVHHPDKEAYKTCNYCHEPVCQDCIVEYSPKTQCKYCYAKQTINIESVPLHNFQYAFWCMGIAFVVICLLAALIVKTDVHTDLLDGVAFALFLFSFVAISTPFQNRIRKRFSIPILFILYLVCDVKLGDLFGYAHTLFYVLVVLGGALSIAYDVKKYIGCKKHIIQVRLGMDEFVANYDRRTYQSIHDDHYDFDQSTCSQKGDHNHQASHEQYENDDHWESQNDEYYENCSQESQNDETYEDDPYGDTEWTHQNSQTDFFAGCDDLSSVKERYRSLSQLYHPDKQNGDTASFQIINNQYEEKIKEFG